MTNTEQSVAALLDALNEVTDGYSGIIEDPMHGTMVFLESVYGDLATVVPMAVGTAILEIAVLENTTVEYVLANIYDPIGHLADLLDLYPSEIASGSVDSVLAANELFVLNTTLVAGGTNIAINFGWDIFGGMTETITGAISKALSGVFAALTKMLDPLVGILSDVIDYAGDKVSDGFATAFGVSEIEEG